MIKLLPLALLTLLALSRPAAAQDRPEGRFHTGALTWTPTLTLRDAGVDTNVYDEASDPKRDQSAVVAPEVNGVLRGRIADVRFGGGVDFVYFQRHTSERSVNTRANVRVEMRGWRVRPFVRGAVLDSRERVNSEIDVRARRADRDAGAGVAVVLTPRGTLELGGQVSRSTFRQGEMFRGVDLARRLNRESVGGVLRFQYELTPLTRVVVDASASRDEFLMSPAYNTDSRRISAGLAFEPDAILKGRATVGVHRLEPRGALGLGFEGMTAAVDLGYVLLQRTRFDLRFNRDTSYSFEAQPYSLQTLFGGQVLHNVTGPIDVIGRVSRETIDYPGIPDRAVPEDLLTITRYGGALAIRPGDRVHLTINYELAERESDFVPDRSFDRRRLYTTLIYGF